GGGFVLTTVGRVQTPTLAIVVEREQKIRNFQPKAYWTIESLLEAEGKKFPGRLVKIEDKKVERTDIDKEEWAQEIVRDAKTADWKISNITQKQRRRNPDPPFITSTLQQEASKRLYFSAKKTMTLAQQLYEGIELGEMGAQGLITYMRTDSTRLSDDAIQQARNIIRDILGKEYLPNSPLEYRNKKNAQDAHEAIRPTSVDFTPEKVKAYLEPDQYKLYELIWKRYLASQMEQAIFDQTSVDMDAVAKNGKKYGFRANGSVLRFDGFLVMWQTEDEKNQDEGDSVQLPDLTNKSKLKSHDVKEEKHFTQPPPRYSESSLIKELEEKGIGRPSTYASILSTIQDRKYVEKKENRFYPTELGNLVTELLVESFSDILNVQFTANLEDQLDQIEEGKANWIKTLRDFYVPFEKDLATAAEKMRNIKREETVTDLKCPKCDKPVILKWGKNGKFAACQGYPDCRFTSEYTVDDGKVKLVEQQVTDEKCPNCSAPMMVKTGRFGKFLACSTYPTCKTTKPITTGIACPDCGQGELSEKRTRFGKVFYSCTKYPNCKYAMWDKPIKGRTCPQCSYPFLAEHYTKKEGASVRCPNKECGFVEKVETPAQ
ncbi:MAG: type I DNA topoisomerase, partial [Proteobacteria bacterium]|nr:type I DNA topoisomerase [Pseudomonadota bacterium]